MRIPGGLRIEIHQEAASMFADIGAEDSMLLAALSEDSRSR